MLAKAPVEGLALAFTGAAAANLDTPDDLAAIGGIPDERLVAAVIDGRNIWTADLPAALATLATLLGLAGTVDVAASCSLLHVTLERDLDPQLTGWFSFAWQKLAELVTLRRGLTEGRAASPIVNVPAMRERVAQTTGLHRSSPYGKRHQAQQDRLHLPDLPTTTIGSFPQTGELRKARATPARR